MTDSATHKNILAIQEYSKETRRLVRELEKKTTQVDALKAELIMLRNQVNVLFQRL